MLPPVLEIYVVWHPDDPEGRRVSELLIDHFHGTAFSGLIGGAVDVFIRSEGWESAGLAPRPIPAVEASPPVDSIASVTAIVPVLGPGLSNAVDEAGSGWSEYLQSLLDARNETSVCLFHVTGDFHLDEDSSLGQMFRPIQDIGAPNELLLADQPSGQLKRDLLQSLTQYLADAAGRLTIFVSHTKRPSAEEEDGLALNIDRVRQVIMRTKLDEFFDASDLIPGEAWADVLEAEASRCAFLGVRSDLYSTRDWCQREISLAKLAGVPVIILDNLASGESRGSFLMDHVPRIPGRRDSGEIPDEAIVESLNQLVNECLKRELWKRQEQVALGTTTLQVAWWAPHAPEPLTLIDWIQSNWDELGPDERHDLVVLHPDPPLGREEFEVLRSLGSISGIEEIEILTPRGLAARGG